VEAPGSESAYHILGENGIVTESLREDPKALNLSANTPTLPQFADALESALDSSSSQVAFDDLTERYRGKKVWVIDRDKIRHRIAQVVDSALEMSEANLEEGTTTRQRVANAIHGLFTETRNIATEHHADIVEKMRAAGSDAGLGANSSQAALRSDALEVQIDRLTDVVRQAEGLVAAMAAALRNIGSLGTGRRRMVAEPSTDPEQNEVLLEIFRSNLELRHAIADAAAPAPVNAA
jgi:hypothetical protein